MEEEIYCYVRTIHIAIILMMICNVLYFNSININFAILKKEIKSLNQNTEVVEEFTASVEDTQEKLFTREDEVYMELKNIETIEDKREWFIRYKEICNEYSDVYPPPVSVYEIYSEDNIYLMQRVIETETYDCTFEEKTHVASVIINRLESDTFGNTVNEVIVPGQFAYWRKDITEDTILALEYAYMIEDTAQGALYFHSGNKTETFSGAKYIFTDSCGHHFYR